MTEIVNPVPPPRRADAIEEAVSRDTIDALAPADDPPVFTVPEDYEGGRNGPWMHTSTGGRWYPMDPRPEELKLTDLVNGNAKDTRYAGQGKVEVDYSVAEHEVLGARWILDPKNTPDLTLYERLICSFLFLIHDASEGFARDLNRAYKIAVGGNYKKLEADIQDILLERYGLVDLEKKFHAFIKEIDCRMITTEKPFVMRYAQPWAFDQFEPLPGLECQGWRPVTAKARWVELYFHLCEQLGWQPEKMEI